MRPGSITLDVRLEAGELEEMLHYDVRRGLTCSPKELSPKWFYDERGCELFDQITRLPEYYPTRRETEILLARAPEIASITRAHTLVELGSGNSEKTRMLLDALTGTGTLSRYVSFDIAERYLEAAAKMVAGTYRIEVHGVVGDFERHAGELAAGPRRVIAFLGSTVGNLYPQARTRFFRTLTRQMKSDDFFLLGADLVKKASRLEAAYNDSAGVTAAFNRNVLAVLNRSLGADFDLSCFEHRALFDAKKSWVEMRLRSTRRQRVTLAGLDLTAEFEEGEEMRTEISTKFERTTLSAELGAAGLDLVRWWTDDDGDYSLSLWSPAPRPEPAPLP